MGKRILDQQRIEGAIALWETATEKPEFNKQDAPWSQFAYETTVALQNSYGFAAEDAKTIVAVTLENSTYDDVHDKATAMYEHIAMEGSAHIYALNATVELMRRKGISTHTASMYCLEQLTDTMASASDKAHATLDTLRGLVSLARWADKRTLKDMIAGPVLAEPGYEQIPARQRPQYGFHPSGGELTAYRSNPNVSSDRFEN